MKIFQNLLAFFILCALVSCSDKGPKFVIEGKISDTADTTMLYLEKRELSQITLLDSVKLGTKGEFKFKGKSTPYPEFYVLRLNGQVINLVIDSTETIKVNASAGTFGTEYTVEGSEYNVQLKAITLAQNKASQALDDLQKRFTNKEIQEQEYFDQIQIIASEYKDAALKIIFSDTKNPASYFALFQKVRGYLFFDPYDKSDYKPFAAVATAWDLYYPNSPRTKHLHDYTLNAIKVRRQGEQQPFDINSANEVDAAKYYNIELPDVNGTPISLSSLKGKVVLLDFTVYQSEKSPEHNIILNRLYNKFKPDFEIYQVSFDTDVHFWKNSASNIPWVAVHEKKSLDSPLVTRFNVQALPALLLINRNGEIVKRLVPGENIETEIQKLL
ncbi:glutathione peroxidase-family protein [Dysgonomonas alginatilytica]|uniref:Glutathione peroxidase-family protein n=1 Tax=Dysgonomonas alginatilytica TaxID=1605892 RepID=A0A2V3PSQ1_9BACT|nr:TlpA disulfide reductase family protein [Dysgonomonas alginatilytica]PXV68039.1 glutathione peroxidase-family protein [Dysgonomonas alginatilytica]